MKRIKQMPYIKHTFLLGLLSFICTVTQAQSPDAKAATVLVSNDKLTVVYTIILTIFVVLVCFLIWLERRLRRIEKIHSK